MSASDLAIGTKPGALPAHGRFGGNLPSVDASIRVNLRCSSSEGNMSDKGQRKRSVSELKRESKGGYSPSQFMRARRPELFSDSKVRNTGHLNKDALD